MKKLIFLLALPFITFSQGLNYVKTTTYKVPTVTSILNPAITDATEMIIYSDGHGKPIQQISHKLSNSGNDIIIPKEYDALGREVKQYLPYTNTTPSLNYNSNAVVDQTNYPDYVGQTAYSENLYDTSLNLILSQSRPGNDWAIGSGHEIKYEYKYNVTNEVKLFIANATWNSSTKIYDVTLSQNGSLYYDANLLSKIIVKNENWVSGSDDKTTAEFTDKSGNLILKRVYDNGGFVDTYYVYDQFGNITYIITPKADASITQNILDNLCYQYKYDAGNRLVEKKIPGRDWQYIVYDKLDRVVAVGPTLPPFSNLSQNGWTITKYDAYNRPVLTAWMTSSSTINSSVRKTKQDDRNAETVNFSESRISSTPDVTISGITFRYSNLVIPTTGYHVLSVNYYDDYNYLDAPSTIPSLIESQTVYYNNTTKPLGLLTGRWIRASKTSTSYRSELGYTLYDEKSRPIREYVRNHETGTGGYTQIDSRFDFLGNVERTVTEHKRIASDNAVKITDFYTYSNQGRLLTHTQQIGTSGVIQLISSNIYNELGKLIGKNVGNTISNPLQKIDYKYNIRGWLTDINDINSLAQSGDPTDLFAFKLNYNTITNDLNAPLISKQYNGNISETYWKTSSDNVLRKYAYEYDNLNRLSYAYYRLPDTPQPSIKSYDEGASYDKNGNIITMHRNGDVEGVSPPINIDKLSYTYDTDSNKLLKVDDNPVTSTSGFTDGNSSGDDFVYDNYGNLTSDKNKGITAIVYNHMNLPIKITFGSIGTIEYIYDADGNKIEKTVTQGSTLTTTKYLDGFQYLNDVLQFFQTSEGYVSKSGSNYKYVFQYKDHVGNVRVSYTKNAVSGNSDIVEESGYYPFGLKHTGYNTSVVGGNSEAQKYKVNNKEYQSELGLNTFDFGARNYDPATARWANIDNLAEKSSEFSPYVYCFNNPVFFTDPDGNDPTPYEAALIAAHVYGGSTHGIGDWKVSKKMKFKIDLPGFKFGLYQRTTNDKTEYVLAYAGTDDWHDGIDNLTQVAGLSKQYTAAAEIAKIVSENLGKSTLVFVGHSLGGGLSNLSSKVTGRSSITFNPAWLSLGTNTRMQRDIVPLSKGNYIHNYVNILDPLEKIQNNAIGAALGLKRDGEKFNVGDVFDSLGDDIYLGHSIDTMIEEMAGGELYDLFAEYHNSTNSDDFYGYSYEAYEAREGIPVYIEAWGDTELYDMLGR